MKNYIYLGLILISGTLSAQFQRGYVQSEIHFKNGEILVGYIFDDFAQNDWYDKSDFKQGGSISGNSSVGSYNFNNFQTIIKTIHYKQNEDDGQQTDYDSETIDFININRQGENQKYTQTKVLRVDLKSVEPIKWDSLSRNIWVPVKSEGKINMYGYYNWAVKKSNGWAEVYFQRAGEEYAINPIQSHKFTLSLNAQRHGIKASFLEVFNDCPEFEENIETLIDEYFLDFKEARKLTKEEKSTIKKQPKDQRDRTEYEIRERNSFTPYENILNKYYQYCGQ